MLPLLLWTAAVMLFFWPLLSGRAHIANGDFSGQFHAFGLFQMRELAGGRFPLWSSGSFGGFPFAADPQSAVFYPLRWLTLLLSFPWRFPYYALQLEAVAHIWLAGAFTYLLAFDLTRRRAAALLAALAFGLGGYLTSYPILQLAILETITWLPLALLLLRRAILGRRPRPYLVAAALALALAATAGHPQTLMHVAYTAAAYYLFLARRQGWPWPSILKSGLLIVLIAVGGAFAALLPAARYVGETQRAVVGYEFVSSGLPLADYFQAVLPGAWTLWSPQYIGVAGLLFAAAALLGAKDAGPRAGASRAEILFWGGVALVAMWISLGDNGILFELVHRVAPGFSLFRQQERLAGVASFALALLAAQGFALWQESPGLERDQGNRFMRLRADATRPALFVSGLLLLAGVTLVAMGEQAGDAWQAGWLRQWLFLLPLAAIFLFVRPSRAAAAAVIALLVVDLFATINPAHLFTPGSPSVFWPRPAWLEPLLAEPDSRFDSQNLFHANLGELYALQDIRGISPLKPAVVAAYEGLPRRLRWQLLNVTHVLAPEPLEPGLTPLMPATESIAPGEAIAATLYRFEDALPRAWLSTEPLFAPDRDAALQAIQSANFDPARQVVLLASAEANAGDIAPVEDRGEVAISHVPRGLDLTVDANAASLLVISEFFRSGWQATIDGEPAPLLEANGGLMAVRVPAGQHGVALRFRPLDVPIGAAVSLITLATAVAVAWRRRSSVVIHPPQPNPFPLEQAEEEGALSMLAWGLSVPERRIGVGVMIGILLLGFGLRAFHIGDQELRGDEAFSYNFSRYELDEVVPNLIEQGDPHPPLHYLLLNVWVRMAGDSELALRYLSAVAGALFLASLYALGRRMGGPAGGLMTGLIAAGLAALSPGLIWLSQDARNQYALVLLFTSLATLVIVTPPRKTRLYWGLYLVACVLTAYTHYYGALVLAGHGLYLWFAPGRRKDLVPWAVTGLLALAVLSVWLFAALSSVLTAGQLGDPTYPELARHLTALGRDLVIGQALDQRLARWLFVLFAGLAAGGYIALRRSGRTAWAAMLAVWVLFPPYVIFLIRFSRGTFNSFYGSVVAPAWWLLVSAAVVAWLRGGGRRRAAAGLLLLSYALAAGLALNNYYFDPRHGRSLGYREVVAYLEERAGPDDALIIPYPDPGWDYYLRHTALTRHMLPAQRDETAAETEATLQEWASVYDRFWFIPYTRWDRENIVGRWLDYHTLREERTSQSRMDLFAYRPLNAAAAAMTTTDQAAAGEFRLNATHITIDGLAADPAEPTHAKPGDALEVTLLWEAIRPATRPATVFIHVLDTGGALVAQHDGIPAYGTRPVPTWQPGERILDRHELVLPETFTGQATIFAGLYDSETLAPVPFANGQATLPLAEIIVRP